MVKLGGLLHFLNCYRQSYEENLPLLPDSIPERCHNTLYDVKDSDKPSRPNILVNQEEDSRVEVTKHVMEQNSRTNWYK